ncbi:MAG: NADH pyrophosphatase [Acidimicrobiales bacterium]|nr:MAG: NUDIX domain-containing protein [Actinomycetota bacterium]MBV6510497.1 NADH pyrophosphatase [Acidimicrobiales bacterium]RIK07151.1 MAG: hypothetical protein DCC48_05030 [Acidobacteriota bacterium]
MVVRAVHRFLLRIFQRLSVTNRRRVVRMITPSFTVGSICIIERDDGAVLLVRHAYRNRWGTPGGLLKKHEEPAVAAKREVSEEVDIRIDLVGQPAVVVDPYPRRVDVVFRARPAEGSDANGVRPRSAEIVEARWFGPDELPELQLETAEALVALAQSIVVGEEHTVLCTHCPVR